METLTQEQLHAAQQRFAEDGYVVLEGLIPLEQVERLKQALLSLEERHGFGYATTSFEGLRTIRINNLLAYVLFGVTGSVLIAVMMQQLLPFLRGGRVLGNKRARSH